MSKVIKNGTVVTADRTWKADVLIDGETIKAVGEDLKGDETIDAFELGVKTTLFEQRLEINATLFHSTIDSLQEDGAFPFDILVSPDPEMKEKSRKRRPRRK